MNENENVQTEGTGTMEGTTGNNIVIETKPGIGKTILKWGLTVLAVIASGVSGFLLGKSSKDEDDNSAETEAPKED